jgi:hypothetical protein
MIVVIAIAMSGFRFETAPRLRILNAGDRSTSLRSVFRKEWIVVRAIARDGIAPTLANFLFARSGAVLGASSSLFARRALRFETGPRPIDEKSAPEMERSFRLPGTGLEPARRLLSKGF